MTEKTIKIADHYINYGGTKINILSFCTRYYVKFLSGSGYGDQSSWCEFNSTYEVYKPHKVNSTELVLCGLLHEVNGTDRQEFHGSIDGKEIAFSCCADSVFMKIFENEGEN